MESKPKNNNPVLASREDSMTACNTDSYEFSLPLICMGNWLDYVQRRFLTEVDGGRKKRARFVVNRSPLVPKIMLWLLLCKQSNLVAIMTTFPHHVRK